MVEVLIVSSIIVVSFLASIAVAQKSIIVSRQALHATQASFLLEEGAEVVRIMRDSNWVNITALSTSTVYYPTFLSNAWSLSATPNTVGIFTRTVDIDAVNRNASTQDIATSGNDDVGTRLVNITVSWNEGATTINKTLSYYISNIF